jgi:hypothetical protein
MESPKEKLLSFTVGLADTSRIDVPSMLEFR